MAIPFSDRAKTITAISVFGIALVFGVFMFLSRYAYSEDGHNILLTIYIVACCILFWGIRKANIALVAIALLLALASQIYAAQKFNWRQSYFESAISGKPFPLEEMIDHYPTFEEYTFSFLKSPNWVDFNNDCVAPALNNGVVGVDCGSSQQILMKYNIDIIGAMKLHTGKMQRTAKMLEEGKLTKRSEYLDCIKNKICVAIPLLPKGVDAEKLDPTSKDYIDIRQAFWSLIKDKKMSKETCAVTDICKALVVMRVINAESMPF